MMNEDSSYDHGAVSNDLSHMTIEQILYFLESTTTKSFAEGTVSHVFSIESHEDS